MPASARPVRACLITNPRSGRGRLDLSEALLALEANGWQVVVRHKQHGGEATSIAREAAEAGCDVVVGCGGDGTLNEIVNGLAGSDVAVGVIPGGTVNLWARELGVSPRPSVAALQLVTAERRQADLGHVEIDGRQRRYFLLMAGLGVDGAVVQRVSKPLKQRIGPLAVGVAAIRALPTFRTTPVQITIDGARWQGEVAQIIAGNTRRYGGFASLTPAARIDDGLLDLCLLTPTGVLEAGRQALALFLRGQPRAQSSETYRAASIRVQSSTVLPLQLDGGKASLKHVKPGAAGVVYTFSARAAAVTVLVPQTYDGGLFVAPPAVWSGWDRVEAVDRVADAHADCAHSKHDGRDSRRAERKRWLRVTSVGVETFSGVRVENGQTLAVALAADATFKRGGELCTPAQFLAALREGDLLHVKGSKVDEGRFIARAIKLVAPE
jgi:YegS/Rv2252/BmrU family lipid kinase